MTKQAGSRAQLLLPIVLVLFLFAQSTLATPSFDERLFTEADKGNLAAVEWEVAKGANVNAHVAFGQTALYVASMRGHLSIVKWLLDHGARVNAKDNDGQTALEITAAFGQP